MFRFAGNTKILTLSVLAVAVIIPQVTQAANKVVAGQYIVEAATVSAASLDSATQDINTSGARVVKKLGAAALLVTPNVSAASLSQSSELEIVDFNSNDSFCARMLKSRKLKSCEPNYVVSINTNQATPVLESDSASPNDPRLSELWGMNTADGVDAQRAWGLSTGSSDQVVAVIDTGIDYNHEDLSANVWVNPGEIAGNNRDDDGNGYIDDIHGINAVNGSGDPKDDNSHGTHVSGTIGGTGNNGKGIVGVNWRVKIMALKFIAANGSGTLADAIEAVEYMVAMKNRGVNIRVSNNSWGGGGYSQALYNAIQRANNAGIIFVAAAGNETNNNDESASYPANYDLPNVVSVAAVDQDGNLASFSNYGETTVDIAAPGVGILSSVLKNRYESYMGTSMATPHVVGSLALLLAYQPSMTSTEAINRLYESGVSLASLEGLVRTARKANVYNMLSGITSPVPAPTPIPAPCAYKVEEIGYSPDTAADSAEVVQQADEFNFYSLDLPFNFSFHNRAVSRVIVSPNGVVYMDRAPSTMDYQNTANAPLNSIAALHTDLYAPSAPYGVRINSSSDKVTIYWLAKMYGLPTLGDVEIRLTLSASGVVEQSLHFSSPELAQLAGSKSTVGLKGNVANSAVTFASKSAKIKDGLALRYSPLCGSSAAVTSVSLGNKDSGKVFAGKSFAATVAGIGDLNFPVQLSLGGRACSVDPKSFSLVQGQAQINGQIAAGFERFKRISLTAGSAEGSAKISLPLKSKKASMRSSKGQANLSFAAACKKVMQSLK